MRHKLKIAFVLHGRFEAFFLALALMERGHDVTVFINYPAFVLRQFCMDSKVTQRCVMHGVVSRIFFWLNNYLNIAIPEKFLLQWFGNWAAGKLKKEKWDLILGMSGISEEFLIDPDLKARLKVVIRGSAHIKTQYNILSEEEKRTGCIVPKPSQWMVSREQSEYFRADKIRVLSRFSYTSFIHQGVDSEKIWYSPSAYPTCKFLTGASFYHNRRQRILRGEPLRVLYVGNLSFQKGMFDLKQICLALSADRYEFRLVGAQQSETKKLFYDLPNNAEVCGKYPEKKLMDFYEWADLFIFPTIQDGFPQVMAQAFVSGLPIMATSNCSSAEILTEGETGWIFPIRRPDLFVKKMQWCEQHRKELADMVEKIEQRLQTNQVRTWDDAAKDVEIFFKKTCR